MAKPVCAISEKPLSFPIMVDVRLASDDEGSDSDGFVIIGDDFKEGEIGDKLYKIPCEKRFHLDAIAEHIATSLIGRVEVLCPSCEQLIDGIRLDVAHVTQGEESAYEMESENPEILALAREIVAQFKARIGHGPVPELTMEQMIAMRDSLEQPIPVLNDGVAMVQPIPVLNDGVAMVQPNVVPHDEVAMVQPNVVPHDKVAMVQPNVVPRNEEPCDLDGCVSKLGPVALFAGILYAGCSLVSSIFSSSSANKEPKKNLQNPRGTFVDTEYLHTNINGVV